MRLRRDQRLRCGPADRSQFQAPQSSVEISSELGNMLGRNSLRRARSGGGGGGVGHDGTCVSAAGVRMAWASTERVGRSAGPESKHHRPAWAEALRHRQRESIGRPQPGIDGTPPPGSTPPPTDWCHVPHRVPAGSRARIRAWCCRSRRHRRGMLGLVHGVYWMSGAVPRCSEIHIAITDFLIAQFTTKGLSH